MKIKTFIEAVCILLIVVLICTLTVMALTEPDYNFEETTYKVESGDCLWDMLFTYKEKEKWLIYIHMCFLKLMTVLRALSIQLKF